jgi:hypothetical protein
VASPTAAGIVGDAAQKANIEQRFGTTYATPVIKG